MGYGARSIETPGTSATDEKSPLNPFVVDGEVFSTDDLIEKIFVLGTWKSTWKMKIYILTLMSTWLGNPAATYLTEFAGHFTR